jgi:hypothetical protein
VQGGPFKIDDPSADAEIRRAIHRLAWEGRRPQGSSPAALLAQQLYVDPPEPAKYTRDECSHLKPWPDVERNLRIESWSYGCRLAYQLALLSRFDASLEKRWVN